MKLYEYLRQTNKKPIDAVIEAGFKYVTFMKWLNGERIPRPKNIAKIAKWSNGRVAPSDFYETPLINKNGETINPRKETR